jgi:hypothetical protein
MKPTVYIETTIVGHLTTRLPNDLTVASQMLATRKWWAETSQSFEICTSDVVLNEASRGERGKAMKDESIVEEVHRIREELLAEFGGDLRLLIADAQRRTDEAVRAGRTVLAARESGTIKRPEPRKVG